MSRIDDLKQEQELIEKSIRLQAQYASEGKEIDKDFVKSTNDRIKSQEEELKVLKSKAGYNEDEAKALERSIKLSKNLLSIYKETGTATGMIVNNLSSVGTGIKDFLTKTNIQYTLVENKAKV